MEVELRPAFVWDCPNCGREVFCRGLVPEMSDEARQELRAEYEVGAFEEGDFVMMPEEVKCPDCGIVCSSLHFHDA